MTDIRGDSTMSTNYRALCAELVAAFNSYHHFTDAETTTAWQRAKRVNQAIATAVAALKAEPEGEGPSVEQMYYWALKSIYKYGSDTLSERADDREWLRAAVAEMVRRAQESLDYGTPVAQPAPEVSNKQIEAAAKLIYASMRSAATDSHGACDWVERGNSLMQDEARRTARAVLAGWGTSDQAIARVFRDAAPAPGEVVQANATWYDIPPVPLSKHDLIEQWNAQADEFNQWDSLETFEQLHWAQARAISVDRGRRLPSFAKKQSDIDALIAAFTHAYSAYGWVTHQQFTPLFDEAARLASIVEEGWDASADPYNIQAKAAAVLSDHHYDLVRQIATEGQIRGAVEYLVSKKHLDGDLLPAIQYAIARWGVSATTPGLENFFDSTHNCSNCQSSDLEWSADVQWTSSGMGPDKTKPVFVQGCVDCSETLRFVDAEEVAAWMNKLISATPPAPQAGEGKA